LKLKPAPVCGTVGKVAHVQPARSTLRNIMIWLAIRETSTWKAIRLSYNRQREIQISQSMGEES